MLRTAATILLPISDPASISVAVKHLRNGCVIAVPTDTLYGLACDATNAAAVDKLYSIKCRDSRKPVAICLNDTTQVSNWAGVQHLPHKLLETLLPGPVTLVLDSTHILNKSLCHEGKVGVRIPDHYFIREICRYLNGPLALTSANLSNTDSSLHVDEFKDLWDRIDAIFDGGTLSSRLASTVVDLSLSGHYKIFRQGSAFQDTTSILHTFQLTPN